MNKLAMTALLVGCGGGGTAQVVRRISVVDHTLLVEKCWLGGSGSDVSATSCATERQPLPVLVVPPGIEDRKPSAEIAFKLDRAAVAREIGKAREALDACGAQYAVHAPMKIKLVIDGTGATKAVAPEGAGPELTACMTAAIAALHFEVELPSIVFTYKPDSAQ